MKKFKLVILTIIFFSLTTNIFCENNKKNDLEVSKTEQFLADARRFEIITLGSLPFVTIDYSLAYSAYDVLIAKDGKVTKISPFLALNTVDISDKDLSFSEKNAKFWNSPTGNVIMGSVICALGVGITDLAIRLVKRNITKTNRLKNAQKNIVISDLENDPDATRLPNYHEQNNSDDDVIVIEE